MKPSSSPVFKLLTGLLILVQIFGLSGCQMLNRAQETASPTATNTPAPVDTATPAPTLPPTATETPAPTATPTEEPTPTATPPGFYSHFNAGFSLTYPSAWETVDGPYALVLKISPQMAIVMYSEAQDKPKTTDEVIKEYQKMFFGDKNVKTQTTEQDEVELADGVSAPRAHLSVAGVAEGWAIYTSKDKRGYYFFLLGPQNDVKQREKTLQRVFSSIRLFKPQPYGLPREQTLIQLGNELDKKDLDTAQTTGSSAGYVGLVYAGLVRLDHQLQVTPYLAEKWETSADGKVYTFTLQPDLKFGNGKPLTAQSVKDSWEYVCDPKAKSTTVGSYLGDIAGVQERLDGKADEISGVKVVDDRTLQVTLVGPRPYFLAKIAYPTAMVIDVSQIEKDKEGWMFKPNPSGPYQVKQWEKEKYLIFERNPNFFKQPAIRYLLFQLRAGGSPISLYEEGSLDILGLGVAEMERVSKPEDPLNKDYHSAPAMCTSFVRFASQRAPFDDPKVRQAFAMATDPQAYGSQLAGGLDLTAYSILPPGMPGYREDLPAVNHDANAARQLLAESKYKGKLPPIVYTVPGRGDTRPKAVSILTDMWKKNLGVNVQVQYIDPDTYYDKMHEQPGHIITFSWCADYPDPENFLKVLFHSDSKFNLSNLADADLDKLLDQADVEMDPAKRLALYQQAEDLVLGQYYAVPLLHSTQGALVNPRVKGFTLVPIGIILAPDLQLEN